VLSAKKGGENLGDREFSFELKDGEGKLVETVSGVKAGDTAEFKKFEYADLSAVGTYTYTIREVNDGQAGVTYDEHVETVIIEVKDGGDGTLAVTYNGAETFETPEFVNSFGGPVKVKKVDVATGKELEGATIQILDSEGNTVDEWVSSAEAHETLGLVPGVTYTLRETAAPYGYKMAADISFEIDETGSVITAGTLDEEGALLMEDEMETVTAAVKKVWDDDDNRDGVRPLSLKVDLLANGEVCGSVTLSSANNWIAVMKGLPKISEGKDIEYTWSEANLETMGYKLTGSVTNGHVTTLTNTYITETTEISVRKAWNDNNNAGGKRPESILVQLYADGVACGEAVALSAANGWAYTWTELAVNTNDRGLTGEQKAIRYTVEETEIPEGYASVTSGSAAGGFVITNTMEYGRLILEKTFEIEEIEIEEEPEEQLIQIPVIKSWDDNGNKDGNRPASVTVHLFAGGTEVASAELNEGNGWRTVFADLPAMADGNAIVYHVTEDAVPMYSAQINGFNINNVYQPELTSATVRKVWNDEDNKHQVRPLNIHATLSNGTTVVLSEANGWTATVSDLPTVVNGEPVTYTWTEQEIVGYSLEKTEVIGNTTIFTNKVYERPAPPADQKKPNNGGDNWYIFEGYDTPLGVEVIINHVGDCFD